MSTALQTQLLFDWHLPAGVDHLTCKEMADATGFTRDFFTRAFDEGRIMGLGAHGRGNGARQTIRFRRENSLLWLVKNSNYDAPGRVSALIEILDRLSPAELDHVVHHATARRQRPLRR